MKTDSDLDLIRDIAANSGGDISVLVKSDGQEILSFDPYRYYEAASIAKLGIVAYTMFLVDIGAIEENHTLKFERRHRRGGTGVLRYFRPGLEMTVSDLVRLILIESDNTATNVLLEAVGPQTRINHWLRTKLETSTTGLADREDCLLETDIMLPEDMLKVFESVIDRPLVLESLSRSHFMDGLRSFSNESSGSSEAVINEAKIWGRIVGNGSRRNILERIFDSEASQIAALKSGILPDHVGHTYQHEAGRFFGNRTADVVVCSRDVVPEVLGEIGLTIHEWCQKGDG